MNIKVNKIDGLVCITTRTNHFLKKIISPVLLALGEKNQVVNILLVFEMS
jgi:hypothetical protein